MCFAGWILVMMTGIISPRKYVWW